ncbi:acyltransferase [Paraburkholderia sp. CNPSo 3076]|uniref:acyltransferase family protein n=1 Tax=Paraburkholderia sp. CNPSo 3076 TaxID=2940936 RepID=UPI0022550B82|nr:acyltransferase [Paraburkholderia sp. CNPSo 3076]MCX5539901.1 acyltransferase [Paraburkholderia sp. CNPSo 3076]
MAIGKLRSVQVLRAFAALGVVAFHTSGPVIRQGWSAHAFQAITRYGLAGVDVFFVISGLVMVLVTHGKANGTATASQFALSRLRRIVPIYWLLTALMLVLANVAPSMFARHYPIWHIVASFLFLPARDPSGLIAPVLNVGWTLNYEMLFYALFAFALVFTRFRLIVVTMILVALSLCALLPREGVVHTFYTSPTMLEFCYGCFIGHLLVTGRRLSASIGAAFLIATLAIPAVLGVKMTDLNRFITFGLPALSLACVFVAMESKIRWSGLLQRIGDASYSLYLTHIFIIPGVVWGFARVDERHQIPGNFVCAVIVLCSVAVGWLVYETVEKRLLRAMPTIGERRAGQQLTKGG